MQLKEQAGEWWEEDCGRKRLSERKIVGRKYGRNIVGGIFWQEKNTWNIGNEQGEWEEGLIVTTENSVSGWNFFLLLLLVKIGWKDWVK